MSEGKSGLKKAFFLMVAAAAAIGLAKKYKANNNDVSKTIDDLKQDVKEGVNAVQEKVKQATNKQA